MRSGRPEPEDERLESRHLSQRIEMVERQIARRGVRDPRVLRAMEAVPRERFVPEDVRHRAYEDCALPIDCQQTISQPYVVATMVEALALGPDDRVLEVGTGSGYAAAVLAEVAGAVYTVERHEELVRAAERRLRSLGYAAVRVRCGDGSLGWPEHAPYRGVLVSAGAPDVPPSLESQLADGGRLVIPVGTSRFDQTLVRVTRRGEAFDRERLGGVRFVPLVGAEGWESERSSGGWWPF